MRLFNNVMKCAAVAVLLWSTQAKADLSDILSKGVVKIAVPESFAPFGSVGSSGTHEGYDVDVAKLIAKDLGVLFLNFFQKYFLPIYILLIDRVMVRNFEGLNNYLALFLKYVRKSL